MNNNIQNNRIIAMLTCLSILTCSCGKPYKPVLNSPQGIHFKIISMVQAKAMSRTQNKPLFVFVHASWSPVCKKMEQEVFMQQELGDAYNPYFISVAIDVDSPEGQQLDNVFPVTATPTLLFFNADGSIKKKTSGFTIVTDLLTTAKLLKKDNQASTRN